MSAQANPASVFVKQTEVAQDLTQTSQPFFEGHDPPMLSYHLGSVSTGVPSLFVPSDLS